VRDVTVDNLQGFQAIIHLAALSNDPVGDLKPDWTYDINHVASVRLARLAKEAGVQRFLRLRVVHVQLT
jgi:nucleoside-diphosphate-sugar epimerase